MTSPTDQPLHALSFDIEDWFHIVEVRALEDPNQWPKLHAQSSLVERYTDLILKICDDHNTRATFFILGWVAERHPQLLARIHNAGHELATHSFWHRKVYELTPDTFLQDLRDSIDAITSALPSSPSSTTRHSPLLGFRAPSFSITPGAEWAFDAILDAGLAYDASLFPAPRGHGGYACTRGPHTITTPKGRSLPELPMSIAPIGLGPLRKPMCYSGGGYLRLLPQRLIRQGVASEAAHGRPTVVYLHPRDFAPDCPRAKMPPHRRFKCYVGLDTTEAKLRALLADNTLRWDTCAAVLEARGLLPNNPPAPNALSPRQPLRASPK